MSDEFLDDVLDFNRIETEFREMEFEGRLRGDAENFSMSENFSSSKRRHKTKIHDFYSTTQKASKIDLDIHHSVSSRFGQVLYGPSRQLKSSFVSEITMEEIMCELEQDANCDSSKEVVRRKRESGSISSFDFVFESQKKELVENAQCFLSKKLCLRQF